MISVNGFDWISPPPLYSNRIRSRDIAQQTYEKVNCEFQSFGEALRLFFTNELIDKIVSYTNSTAMIKAECDLQLSRTEFLAFIGTLILIGSYKDNDLEVDELWSELDGQKIYNGSMPRHRFRDILR